jgi:hypothetical protein
VGAGLSIFFLVNREAMPMTEQEWLARTDPKAMLELLLGKVSDRKLRLFASACCRRVWLRLKDHCLREAVEISEKFADRNATASELAAASEIAWNTKYQLEETESDDCDEAGAEADGAEFHAAEVVAQTSCNPADDGTPYVFRAMDAAKNAAYAAGYAITEATFSTGGTYATDEARRAAWRSGWKTEQDEQANLVRDIAGNPFRPVAIDPRWLTSTVTDLATAIYEERAFDRMPILADALQDAGCDNDEIIGHCRGPGPHVRGCWVVDLILGES